MLELNPDPIEPGYIYVASSWRNPVYPAVIAAFRAAGLECYDFRNPEGGTGFAWREAGMPSYNPGTNGPVPIEEYREAMQTEVARAGFASDMAALQRAQTVVMILECGKSAHLELGYACGVAAMAEGITGGLSTVNTAILLPDDVMVPELMYGMVDYLAPDMMSLLAWLGVKD